MQIQLKLNITQGDVISGHAVEIIDAPALAGTDKQVAYAADIRASSIKDFVEVMVWRQMRTPEGRWLKDATFASAAILALVDQANAGLAQLADVMARATDAKQWIEIAGGSKSLLTAKAILNAMLTK